MFKILNLIVVILFSISLALGAESSTDLFDTRASSGLVIVSSDSTQGGAPAINMFQGGVCLYDDQSGTPTTFSTTFEIDDMVHLDSINFVSVASRTYIDGPLVRAAGSIKLEANQRDTGTWVEILNKTISHSDYNDDYSIGNFTLDKSYTITEPHAATEFKVTYTKLDNAYWAPRIDELDGIGSEVPVPENANLKYIVVNVPIYLYPSVFDKIREKLPVVPNSQILVATGSILRPLYHSNTYTKGQLEHCLTLAQDKDIPIVTQFDLVYYWDENLWNFWMTGESSYDPSNKDNVEWYGWNNSYAIKGIWANWGTQVRFHPSPNLSSTAYLNACYDKMGQLIPIIEDWWGALSTDEKELFIGVKPLWEAGIGNNFLNGGSYFYNNGNYYFETWPDDPSHDPTSGTRIPLGYATVKTAGIKTSGALTEADGAEGIRRYAENICQDIVDINMPRDKVMTHGQLFMGTNENIYAMLNEYSCPGWSYYGSNLGGPRGEYANCNDAVNRSDAPFWCVPEFFWQGTSTTSNWRTALENMLDERCRYVNIYNWDDIDTDETVLEAIRQVIRHVVIEADDDLFDLRGNSGLTIVSSDAGLTGQADPNEMFDSGIFIYDDTSESAYTTTFQIDNYVELNVINLFGGGVARTYTNGPLIRAIGGIKLEANQNDTGTWIEILNETISGSLHYDDDGSVNTIFDIHESFPVTNSHVAKEFRVTYSYLDSTSWGPRIDELDGFGNVMPAPTTGGSSTDLFDLRGSSGLTITSTADPYSGFYVDDMFDTGALLYADTGASTYMTTFEISNYVELNSIRLISTASRLWSAGPLARAVGGIKLEANHNDTGRWVEILNESISHGDYADDGSIASFVLTRPFTVTTLVPAKEFRVTYTYLDSISWGPRIDEFDGFGNVVTGPGSESASDVFDIRNGSGLTIVSSDPAKAGFDVNDMFDSGVFLYDDTGAYSYTTTFEINSATSVDSIRLVNVASRGIADGPLTRSIGRIILEANTNLGAGEPTFVKILDETILHGDYGDNGSVTNFTLNSLFDIGSPVSAKEYRITYFVLDDVGLAPRIDELDAFDG